MEFLMGFLIGLPICYGLIRLIRLWREGKERETLLDDACQRVMLRFAAAHGRADLIRSISRNSYASSPRLGRFIMSENLRHNA
jgi:hypothetical protein